MAATTQFNNAAHKKQVLKSRAYAKALTVLRDRHQNEYHIAMTLAELRKEGRSPYKIMSELRERWRSEFDKIREDLYLEWSGESPPPTEEEEAAALVSIQEAMKELAVVKPEKCGHDGGRGIGAGHICICNRTKDHPLDSERPHGCSCGALWGEHRNEHVNEHTNAPAKAPTIHDQLLTFLEEQGCEMPPIEAFPGLRELQSDPDARSYVREQVMVVAVLAHHLGTSVEECLALGVAC